MSDIATNSMGSSSSTPSTGAIDTYDPLLGKKKKKLRDITPMIKRKIPV